MSAGYCSDQELLVKSPSAYGACVSPRVLPVGAYAGSSVLPFCLPSGKVTRLILKVIFRY
jgi:hypothetical protein